MIRDFDGNLAFVPDELLGDDPDRVKRELRAAFALVLEGERPFEYLLFSHGEPLLEGGRDALARFLS